DDPRKESVMGFLDELLSGGQRQKDYRDFVSRYDQGHPSEGYSDQEVLDRYRDVAEAVPPDQYSQAAQDALARLSPEQRAQAQGVTLPAQVGTSPRDLGSVFADLHQSPGRLRELLGGGGGAQADAAGRGGTASMLSSPLAKAALAGIAALVARRYMGGR